MRIEKSRSSSITSTHGFELFPFIIAWITHPRACDRTFRMCLDSPHNTMPPSEYVEGGDLFGIAFAAGRSRNQIAYGRAFFGDGDGAANRRLEGLARTHA